MERNADKHLKGIIVTGVNPGNRRKVYHFNKDPFKMKGSLLKPILITGFSNRQNDRYQSIVINAGRSKKKAFHLRCYTKKLHGA